MCQLTEIQITINLSILVINIFGDLWVLKFDILWFVNQLVQSSGEQSSFNCFLGVFDLEGVALCFRLQPQQDSGEQLPDHPAHYIDCSLVRNLKTCIKGARCSGSDCQAQSSIVFVLNTWYWIFMSVNGNACEFIFIYRYLTDIKIILISKSNLWERREEYFENPS